MCPRQLDVNVLPVLMPLQPKRTFDVDYASNVDQFLPPPFRDKFRDIDQLMCQKFEWREAQSFQVDGALLQLAHRDTIVHAGTGKGKTAVAAAPYVLDQNCQKITIVVSPLLALQEDMADSFSRKFHISAIALNSLLDAAGFTESITEILAGRYRVILISPECLLSHRIRDVLLTNDNFKKRVFSIVIDEAHVIAHWGSDFRKKYASLHIVRNYLPGIPIVCLSATLTPRTIRHISLNLDMKNGTFAVINEGNERPDLSIAIRAYRYPASSFLDLLFPLIPPLAPSVLDHPDDIKQFIVFFNSKNEVHQALRVVNSSLPLHMASLGLFRPYTARQSPQYRAEVMRRFKAGDVRGLFGTEAWGVVPLSVLLQHWGRAARGEGETGLAVMLVPPAAYKVNPTEPGPSRATSKPTSSRSKVETKQNMKEPLKKGGWDSDIPGDQPEIREDSPYEGTLVMVQTHGCQRKVWTQVFQNTPVGMYSHYTISWNGIESTFSEPIVECCTNCSSSLADRIQPPKQAHPSGQRPTRKPKQGVPHRPTQVELTNWRERVWARDYPGVSWGASVILSDNLVDLLSSVGRITTLETLKRLLDEWGWWETYGNELARVVYPLDIPFAPAPPRPARGRKRKTAEPDPDPTTSSLMPTNSSAKASAAKQARSAVSSKQTKVRSTPASSHQAKSTQKPQRESHVSSSSKPVPARPPPPAWTPLVYPQPTIPLQPPQRGPPDQSQPRIERRRARMAEHAWPMKVRAGRQARAARQTRCTRRGNGGEGAIDVMASARDGGASDDEGGRGSPSEGCTAEVQVGPQTRGGGWERQRRCNGGNSGVDVTASARDSEAINDGGGCEAESEAETGEDEGGQRHGGGAVRAREGA
ncbi:hypothetical protein FRC07_014689 [Ceratobasidium sp. 392]|nr:hypothetical protein FRC07_014689 [Ceratobasidium sp. 392]